MIDETNEQMVERAREYAFGCGLDLKQMVANGLRSLVIYDDLDVVRVILKEPSMFMISQRDGKYLLGELAKDAE